MDGPTLRKVVWFMQQYEIKPYRKLPKLLGSEPLEHIVSPRCYLRFLNRLSPHEIRRLVLASDYVQVEPLLELLALLIATLMRPGPSSIVGALGADDVTEAEIAETLLEHPWILM